MARKRQRQPVTVRLDQTGIFATSDDGDFVEQPFQFQGDPRDAALWAPDKLAGLLNTATSEAISIQHAWFQSLSKEEWTLLERTDPGTPGRPVAPAAVRDAGTVQQCTGAVRFYQNSNAEAALFFAVKAGMAYQRMLLREAEPLARKGVAATRGRKKAAATTNAEHAEYHANYQPFVDDLMKDGLSYHAACQAAAKHFGYTVKTIKRHTINKRPMNRGRQRE